MVTLILPRDLGKKAYRMKCRFVIEPRPTREHLKAGALRAMELFVRDMGKQGWEYLAKERVRLKGPLVPVAPMDVHRLRMPSAREMLPMVRQGARFLAGRETLAAGALPLAGQEKWEYELALVFARQAILCEAPDPHEEKETLRTR